MKKNYFSSETGILCASTKLSKTYLNKWFFLSLAFLFSLSCKKVTEQTGLIGICPQVISVTPLNASGGNSLTPSISAVFNEPMDASTITIATFTVREGTVPIAGVIAFSGNTATFSPTKALTPFTTYTATMNAGVKDIAKNAMISDYKWSFTTGADPAPTVTSTDPVNLATGVAFNKMISAAFSKPMDSLSATKSISITNTSLGGTVVLGSVTYSGTTVVFKPTTNLLPSTSYSATISTVAKDLAGTFLKSNYTWNFTTGKAPDIIPPTIVSTDPINSAIGVPFNQKLSANFSEAMDPATITAANFKLANTTLGGTNVTGTVLYSGTSATFTPAVLLLPNTTYTATITTAVKDLAAVSLTSNYTWSFTTGNVPDAISPTIVSTDPARFDISVPLNKTIAALFSEAMDQSTITTGTFTLANATLGGIIIPGTVNYTGVTAVFVPLNSLSPNTTYTASISTGAKDLAGNSIVSNYYWSFTTGAIIDVTAPTVISTDPANNATGVALNKIIAATFSETMNPASISITSFLLKNGTTPITGIVNYVGVIGTFTPTSLLTASTLYTATITTIAKDLAGNSLVSDYVWTFTTGAALDIIPPTVILTDPLNNAIGVPVDKKITATFSEAMNPATISTVSYTLYNGANGVAGNVTYLNNVATFSPSVILLSNTVYTATITTAAKDLAGNALVSNYVWTFTTALPIIPPVVLGSAANFGAFGGSAGITNQGLNTVINNGGIGTTGASTLITGFHDGLTAAVYTETPLNVGNSTGGIYTAPPAPGTATSFTIAQNGLNDATTAFNSISPASKPGGTDPGAGELGGLTLAPGIYKSASGTFKITNGNLTLDAMGDPNAYWIFQTASGLTVGIAGPSGAKSVLMINGGLPKNVYWYVGSAATINGAGGGVMVGTILASAGVTFSTAGNAVQTVLNGRAISLNASVTMVNTTINVQ
ncbi:MAG: Ig-like domain-containing protein [Chitinophagaceae bacterium]|nr:Ig-like domain-containing protein [Chitinophagaceae bacterium]